MSLLAAPSTPANASRRMANSSRIASNILGTPVPVLWGTRDLSGTLVAWTNLSYNSGGSSGKGGGVVSAGDRYYRTFALCFCLGPCDTINSIWYDNQMIWQGPVSIASALATANAIQGAGSVMLTDNPPTTSTPGISPIPVNNNRGTICFYFGTDTQTQDPFLAQFIPNAPFFRGMVYAVFHGPRTVSSGKYSQQGFRIGSADTLAQIAINVTRIPPEPTGSVFSVATTPAPAQIVTCAARISGVWDRGPAATLTVTAGADDGHLSVTASSASGDTAVSQAANGVEFEALPYFYVTLTWPSSSQPVLPSGVTIGFNLAINGTTITKIVSSPTLALDVSIAGWSGRQNVLYQITVTPGIDDTAVNVEAAVIAGVDTVGGSYPLNGVAFAVGTLGLMVTLSWQTGTIPLAAGQSASFEIVVSANAAAGNLGANPGAMVYELLTSTVAGFALNPAIIDETQFGAFAGQANYAGLNYMTTEKADARGLIQDILKNVQAALTISNGLIAPRMMGYLPGTLTTIAQTLDADDVIGYKIRPGAWYELPQHLSVKYRDSGRLFRDTVCSLPGAGSVGNDEKAIEIDLPMVTDLLTARVIGLRMMALEQLPKKPDTLICGRGAFPIQFGDIIALNNPRIGTLPASFNYQPGSPLVVLAVREHGPGDETIELDVAPDVFGYLPVNSTATGGGGGGIPAGPAEPYYAISVQGAFEFPYDWDPSVSRLFCLFAARTDPDAQGFTLWASDESPPVDYSERDTDALFCAGGTIQGFNAPRFTMDRTATIQFTAASQDIDAWQSVSDTGWLGYQFLVLLGGSGLALLYAAKNLNYLGDNEWEIEGLWGPLSDTIGGTVGTDVWVFALQPPYDVPAQPSEVIGVTISFKGIPFGSRLSPTLAAATAAPVTVAGRSACPRAPVNPNANGRGANMFPSYGGAGVGNDIALAWDLCNRGFGFGQETNPCEFDPGIQSEVAQCQVDVVVGGTVVKTYTVSTREFGGTGITSGTITAQTFPISSTATLQPGDRISVVRAADPAGTEWFGRVATISGNQVTLVSPLCVIPSAGDTFNRYESCGFVYTAAQNLADNGSLPSAITFNIYGCLNGLRSLQPATITVTKT
ncbi:MAG: phage tail protein [Verrucomicrobiia bacterium]